MQPGGVCLYPMPRLDLDEQLALEIFRMAPWRSGMGGREGISYHDAEAIARAYDVEWDGDLLELLRVCEGEILKGDAKQREAASAAKSGTFGSGW